MRNTKTFALVESALLIAMAFALSYVRLFRMPQGGSVTAVSMLPILLIGIRRGPFWGVGSGVVYGLLQLLQEGGLFSPAATFVSFSIELFLDYILAFGVLGLSALFAHFKHGLIWAVSVCIVLRFLCHLVSGVVVWYPYAPEGQNVWIYSFGYNGSFLGAELILTLAAAIALLNYVPWLCKAQNGMTAAK